MVDYKQQLSRQQLLAEDRLAYVAVTRAKRLLVGTGHSWRSDLSNARAASTYLQAIIEEAVRHNPAARRGRATRTGQSTGDRGAPA